MSNLEALQKFLKEQRVQAKQVSYSKERDKGTFFEDFTRIFFKKDKMYRTLYPQIYTYSEWAKSKSLPAKDDGVDLVAINQHGKTVAIQCKFYSPDTVIQKDQVKSFLSAMGKSYFDEGIFVDSTDQSWTQTATDLIKNRNKSVNRLSLQQMAESNIKWNSYNTEEKAVQTEDKKSPHPHQITAIEKTHKCFKAHDRGKLIMACGTGKTYTSLKIAEEEAGKGKTVLYLVPSLSLMQQSISKWYMDSSIDISGFSVCSDATIGKKKSKNDDSPQMDSCDLALPATTDAQKIASTVNSTIKQNPECMTVVFSTYQSIQVVSDAQKKYNMTDFDLIICDEAHRTTGATLKDEDDSNFVKVHKNSCVQGKKRLYMTATPRIYDDKAKDKANENEIYLASMNDEETYGQVIHTVSFNDAVEKGLLCDYKVIVLTLNEGDIDASFQRLITDSENFELQLEDTTKLIGCYKALCNSHLESEKNRQAPPMKRAIAFCQSIQKSKDVTKFFPKIANNYREQVPEDSPLDIEVQHIDGTFNSKRREQNLHWLKENSQKNVCRILSNARCLSEGVDVPSLDAILFLHPRKSMIDVVQAVGRVMRTAPNKKMGYVILPVAIPAGISPTDALAKNKKYKVVWQVLNALRSHDERLEADINALGLGDDISSRIELVSIANILPQKVSEKKNLEIGYGSSESKNSDHLEVKDLKKNYQNQFNFGDSVNKAILSKLVQKCGSRLYWTDWAKDIAEIAQRHRHRITTKLKEGGEETREFFNQFLRELQDDLNPSVSKDDAIEMLSQHMITKPVFDALFEGYEFTKKNPVSIAIEKILHEIQSKSLDKETEILDKFYNSVRRRVQSIKSLQAKQNLIVELYDKFFKGAFPKMVEQLGIVYTPIECVDFIIHSIEHILQTEFKTSLENRGVNIIEPFTGTGSFIVRLLQSGLISPQKLKNKYQNEIHANEIVLLAYYIASINIEQVYHEIMKENGLGDQYEDFKGICLTDTFQMHETDDTIAKLMPDNSQRRTKQKSLDIRVIMGNPPYSAGQKSSNDNAQNVSYPNLDQKIQTSYVDKSNAILKNKIYDNYIRAIRWGFDRIGNAGVMGYISNGSWISAQSSDGLRQCLQEECSSIYVFDLRGDQRTKGEVSKKEGGQIFGAGSRASISITFFIKNPHAKKHGQIYYHNIGDHLNRDQKLSIISNFSSVEGIKNQKKENFPNGQVGFKSIIPNKYNDWINQRSQKFYEHLAMGDPKTKKKIDHQNIFNNFSLGITSNRDFWVCNSSKSSLKKNMKSTIDVYNSEIDRYAQSEKNIPIKNFVTNDKTKISWTTNLKKEFTRGKEKSFNNKSLSICHYRPFTKQFFYYNKEWNERTSQLPKIFPFETKLPNRCICVSGKGANLFSSLIVDTLPNLDTLDKTQVFPLYLYEKNEDESLFDVSNDSQDYSKHSGISDLALSHFSYSGHTITKEDLFYYIYGVLQHPEYIKKYEKNLTKDLPRIPKVKTHQLFSQISQDARALADLHIGYESVEPYPVTYKNADPESLPQSEELYRVTKMKFGKNGKDKKNIVYNGKITLSNIPLEVYAYKVNGYSPVEWVMTRQEIKVDKASGIENDSNRYAIEAMNDPKYPLLLLRRAMTVSLETQKILNSLPDLDF